jgi:hypothetical protein
MLRAPKHKVYALEAEPRGLDPYLKSAPDLLQVSGVYNRSGPVWGDRARSAVRVLGAATTWTCDLRTIRHAAARWTLRCAIAVAQIHGGFSH